MAIDEHEVRFLRMKHLKDVPLSLHGIMLRAFAGDASPRKAIKAKCLSCADFDRREVAECTVVICPLHAYRPYQPGSADALAGSGARGGDVDEPAECAEAAESGETAGADHA